MQQLDDSAWQFLENKGPRHFCRLFFKSYAKCDSVDNNMAEIFNAFIIEERFMPIWTMLDAIFKKVMTRVASRKQMSDHLQQDICPVILKKLEKAKDLCRQWHASRGGNGMYSVTYGSVGFVVDMVGKTCTCNAWELSGIPCHHALAVMREENMDPIQFVHKCYNTSMLRKTYAHTLKPVNGTNLWSPCEDEPILAPFFKQKKGVIINLKGAPKKERKDLGVNMELYLVRVVPLSVQYANNMAITRRHVDRRLCYFRTFIFFSIFFFPKDIFVICFLLIFLCVISGLLFYNFICLCTIYCI